MSAEKCYPDKAPKVDALLNTLSHSVRREVIHFFENHSQEPAAGLDELAAHIAERMPEQTRENLILELPQTHLSILESRGWLVYSDETGEVTYHGNGDAERLLGDVLKVFNE